MTWFGRQRLSAAEALELELAGTVTDSSTAELLAVTDLLRTAAQDLPAPSALRARRSELVALVVAAAAVRVGQLSGRGGRLIRAPMIVLATTIIAVASVLGATLVMSWLDASSRHLTPPSISEPATGPDPSTGPPAGASPQPHASQSEPPGFTDQGPAGLPADLSAELLAQLQAELQTACGEEAALPELNDLDETEARAVVDALIAACETVLATPSPLEMPSPLEAPAVLPADLSAELLAELHAELLAELHAELQAACGQQATLPDLTGLDEAEARALVDTLIAACEAVPGTLLP